ncbi:hypothetical protein [Pseudomonas sp.]|uniref:hypothetical protein n=1 Tax=Pseudomonas sp. TaxID=306 RepID=UPI003D6ED4FC
MSDKNTIIAEIIKYPIIIFSILLSLVAAKHILGLEFGVLTEISINGAKFAEKSKATADAIASIDADLRRAVVDIEQLKKVSNPIPNTPAMQTESTEAAETVSDQTAKIEQIQISSNAKKTSLKGYIWIGNYNNNWKKRILAQPDTGQPIDISPNEMQRGTEYAVLGNMVVRDGLPENNQNYFNGRSSLGVVPSGTRIRLTNVPVAIEREFATQYWAEIEVL